MRVTRGSAGGARARPRRFGIGTVIQKFFQGYGTFRGRITKLLRRPKVYRVLYDDGDEEDLDTSEIEGLLETQSGAAVPNGRSAARGAQTQRPDEQDALFLVDKDYRLLLRSLGAKGQLCTGTQGYLEELGELLTRMGSEGYDYRREDEKPFMYHCPIIAKICNGVVQPWMKPILRRTWEADYLAARTHRRDIRSTTRSW